MAHLGAGAVAVVRHRLDEHRDAARAVALVDDVLERLGVGALARALGDRALDVVLRHRRVARLGDGQRERAGCRRGRPRPPCAATVIARASLVKSLPRRESTIAFLCLIPAHLECPAIAASLPTPAGGPEARVAQRHPRRVGARAAGTPPPGCAAAEHRYTPGTGVSGRPRPVVGRNTTCWCSCAVPLLTAPSTRFASAASRSRGPIT